MQEPPWLQRTHQRLQSSALAHRLDDRRHGQWGYIKRRASSILRKTENLVIKSITRLALLYPFHDKESTRDIVEKFLDERVKSLKGISPHRKWEWLFFRPLEAFNAAWLVYIVVAQTWGFYKTCDCVTSNWGSTGGYLDFRVQDVARTWVEAYWLTGTLLTSSVMGFSMFYITVEWCQQSFLSTEDYDDARQGLRMTRIYRHWTFPFRSLSRLLSRFTFDPMERFAVAIGLVKYRQKTLLWTKIHTHDPDIALPAPLQTSRPHGNPSIELSDFSNAMARDDSQHSHAHAAHETPAMAHSLFPPAIPRYRPRQDSDASAARPSPSPPLLHGIGNPAPSASPPSLLAHRPSHDSALSFAPLLQRPSEAHHHREHAGSATAVQSDERDPRSSGEEFGLISPVSPVRVGEYTPCLGMVQSRQGYMRVNSDPGSPPGVDALGIRMGGVADDDLERGEGR